MWADQHERYEPIWIGFDERLGTAFDLVVGQSAHHNWWVAFTLDANGRTYVISDVVRAQSARLGRRLPAVVAENRIYDNGRTQIYGCEHGVRTSDEHHPSARWPADLRSGAPVVGVQRVALNLGAPSGGAASARSST